MNWGGLLDESSAAEIEKAGVFAPRSAGRRWIALGVLLLLSALAVKTIDPGKLRAVVLLLMGFLALRIVLTAFAAR